MKIHKGNGSIPKARKGQRNRYPWAEMGVSDYLAFGTEKEASSAYNSAANWVRSGSRRRKFVRRGKRVYRES